MIVPVLLIVRGHVGDSVCLAFTINTGFGRLYMLYHIIDQELELLGKYWHASFCAHRDVSIHRFS
jgi:hypothetical protein